MLVKSAAWPGSRLKFENQALTSFSGTAVFAELHPAMSGTILKAADLGKIRFPEVLGLPPWILIGILAAAALGLFAVLRKTERPEG